MKKLSRRIRRGLFWIAWWATGDLDYKYAYMRLKGEKRVKV